MNDGLSPGQRIGEYTLEERIGEGGFSSVWRAHHYMWEDRKVAAKILKDSEQVRLLKDEADCLAKLSHPGIVTALGIDLDHDPPYLLMELHEGQTLRDLLKEERKLSPAKTFALFSQIVAALAHSHALGITHGDLKPENVLIDAKGRAKLSDFGLGRVRATEASLMLSANLQTQGDASLAGTIPYMAPEQRDGQPADPTSDVFALGILLHEMLTGRRPQPGDHPGEDLEDPPSWLSVWEKCYTRRDRRLENGAAVANALGLVMRRDSERVLAAAPPVSTACGPWKLEAVERAVAKETGLQMSELLHRDVADAADPLTRLFAKAEQLFMGEDSQVEAARRLVWFLASEYMDVPHRELADRYGTTAAIVRKGVSGVRGGRASYQLWRGVVDRLAPLPPSFVKKAEQADAGKAGRIAASIASLSLAMFAVMFAPIVAIVASSPAWVLAPILAAILATAFGASQLRRRLPRLRWVEEHLDEIPGPDRRTKLTWLSLHTELPVAAAAAELLEAEPPLSVISAEDRPDEVDVEESSRQAATRVSEPVFAREPPPAPGIERTLEAVHRAMAEAAAEATSEPTAEPKPEEPAAESEQPEPAAEPEPVDPAAESKLEEPAAEPEPAETSVSLEPAEPRAPIDEAMRIRAEALPAEQPPSRPRELEGN